MASTSTTKWAFFCVFLALFICSIVSWYMRKHKVTFVPESGVFILIGAALGGLNYLVQLGAEDGHVALIPFDANIFLYGYLPVIIFEAGFSMNKREFFNNIGIINMLAVLGTIISTLIVGYGMYWFETLGYFTVENNSLDMLMFGSLISAVDPVATLVVFSSLNVDRTLYAIVFGESVMNDAVSVALYQTFATFKTDAFGAAQLFEALGLFLAKFIGSFLVAILLVAVVAKFLKHNHVEQTYLVLAIFTSTAYIIYNLCEGIYLSGILGVFFCGMALKHYAFYNVSHEAQHTSEHFLKTLAFMTESLIYLFLGMSFFDYVLQWDAVFILWACALCLIGRALNVFPLVNFTNMFRVKKVTFPFQLLIWHSGLRGAIAFALAMVMLDTPAEAGGIANKEAGSMIVAATLVIVIATTFLVGGSTPAALKALNIKIGDVDDDELDHSRNAEMHTKLHQKWHDIDGVYLVPFLTNKTFHKAHSSTAGLNSVVSDNDESQGLLSNSESSHYGTESVSSNHPSANPLKIKVGMDPDGTHSPTAF